MKEIDVETKLKVLDLYLQGPSNREIGEKLGISHPTVGKVLDEIRSGRSGYVPGDIVSEMDSIKQAYQFMRQEGISSDEMGLAVITYREMKKLGLDNSILLETAKIYKEQGDSFPSVLEATKFIIELGRRDAASVQEVPSYVQSLLEKRKYLEADVEKILIEIGRREEELENLRKELERMADEAKMLTYIREKLGKKQSLAKKIVDVASNWEYGEDRLESLLKTLKTLIDSGENPEKFLDRGGGLEFLASFGITGENVTRMVRNVKSFSSFESLVSSFLSYASERDKLVRKAIEEADETARLRIQSYQREMEELRNKTERLRDEVSYLAERKERLESDVSSLERVKDALSMENFRKATLLRMLLHNIEEGWPGQDGPAKVHIFIYP
jgi:DNA repair exonuclease SbcCD ATPase subunit